MKKTSVLTILLLTIVSFIGGAQEWAGDFKAARSKAQLEDKVVLLVFQGSDWCAPCMKLDRTVWSTDEFKSYAKDHFVLVKADFPRRKKNQLSEQQTARNQFLFEKYNQSGVFPLVVILDSQGKVLGKEGYKRASAKEYIALINKKIRYEE